MTQHLTRCFINYEYYFRRYLFFGIFQNEDFSFVLQNIAMILCSCQIFNAASDS